MRRFRFVIPTLLFSGACNASALVGPTTPAEQSSSTITAVDSAWTADAPADSASQRENGILIGSGT
jgi:hypothetical protein